MKSISMVWIVACRWWAKWKIMQMKEVVNVEKTVKNGVVSSITGDSLKSVSERKKKRETQLLEKSALLMEKLRTFLLSYYEFRYNVLTEVTEFRPLEDKKKGFRPAGQRELNSICMDMRAKGIDCWDKDLFVM